MPVFSVERLEFRSVRRCASSSTLSSFAKVHWVKLNRRQSSANQLLAAAGLAIALCVVAGPVAGQQDSSRDNPVFIHDSPAAADTLTKIADNIAAANLDQAVRLLQRLLDEEPNSLVPHPADAALFVTARDQSLAILKSDEKLLALYRRVQEPIAAEMLKRGEFEAVERTRFLTTAGLTATLHVANTHLEAARFAAAVRTLGLVQIHPDLRKEPKVAQFATLLSRYDRSERTLALVKTLGASVGEPITPPELAISASPLAASGPADLKGLVAKPLATEPHVGLNTDEAAELNRNASGPGSPELPRQQRLLTALPTIRGDTVFVASARAIAALDRFTLRERWRIDTSSLLVGMPEIERSPAERGWGGGGRFGRQSVGEDATTVAVTGSTVVCAAQSPANSNDDGREAIVGLDARTGELRWRLSPAEIDPALDGTARVRGPMLSENGIAVVTFRKELTQKRVQALYAAGIEAATGRPLWCTLVSSIGSLPWNRGITQATDGGVITDGVFYRADRMGLIAAYSIADGRPLWIRRFASELYDSATTAPAYAIGIPVIDGDHLIALTPDRRQIVTLDRRSGALVSTLSSDRLGRPSYLLKVGNLLAGVTETRVAAIALDGSGPAHLSAAISDSPASVGGPSPIRGRVIVAGDRILIPTARGVTALGGPDLKTREDLPLDAVGNIVYDGGQLLACDDARCYSYLAWDEANRLLTARITADKADAASGVALTELAFRAGHPERILFGADAAIAALGDRGRADPLNQDRVRLTASLCAIAQSVHARPAVAAAARPAQPKAVEVDVPQRPSLEVAAEIVVRIEKISVEPAERAAMLLIRGDQRSAEGKPTDASASYQAVLDNPALIGAVYQGQHIAQRADSEASRRLEGLVLAAGRSAYAAQDAQMQQALTALGGAATSEDLEAVARRFPVGAATPSLWMRVASMHDTEGAGGQRAASRALEMALLRAERMPDAPLTLVGEIAGRLVDTYAQHGPAAAALDTIKRVRTRFGEVALTSAGKPIDGARVAGELAARINETRRWPRVGAPIAEGVQAFAGATVMPPILEPLDGVAPRALALITAERDVAIYAPKKADDGQDSLVPLWSTPLGTEDARLVKLDAASAFFYFFGAKQSGTFSRVDLGTGERAWKSKPLNEYFGEGEMRRQPAAERFRHPLGPLVSTDGMLTAMDERSAVLVERSGRTVALDVDSGTLLWAAATPVERVFDCAVAGNLLVIAGERPTREGADDYVPTLLMIDSRTGQVVRQFPDGAVGNGQIPPAPRPAGAARAGGAEASLGQIRWVRISPRGEVIAGTDGGLIAIDPDSGREAWLNPSPAALRTVGAWLKGDNMLVIGEDRQVWSVAVPTGVMSLTPVDTRGRLLSETDVSAFVTAEGNFALCSAQGVAILSADGKLVGTDALGATDNLLTPVPGQGVLVTMETGTTSPPPVTARGFGNIGGIRIQQGGNEPTLLPYNLHIIDAKTGMLSADASLLLGEVPTRVTLLDNFIAVTAGHSTIVYRAPMQVK